MRSTAFRRLLRRRRPDLQSILLISEFISKIQTVCLCTKSLNKRADWF